ncbi:MAG: thioredoxin family protein [Rhodospirillales bacterium]|nr:thioredoxin family protein [Rhodospirillales bacterium]
MLGLKALVALMILSLLAGPSLAAQSETAGTERVQVRLLSDRAGVVPGKAFTLALEQNIVPGWHTYWLNPGDSGLPTEIDWQLPEGARAGPILWPHPHRFDVGPITNYGFSDRVALLSEIVPPENLQPGDSFPIRAQVRWLVCEEICIPEEAELALTLPAVATLGEAVQHPALEAARSDIPVASPWASVTRQAGERVELHLDLPPATLDSVIEAAFFPDAWGQILHSGEQRLWTGQSGLVLSLEPDTGFDPSRTPLRGVLVLTERLADGSESHRALTLEAKIEQGAMSTATATEAGGTLSALPLGTAARFSDVGFLPALLFALLGGIVLNLMPCVFPVLSIKILSLSQQLGGDRRHMRRHGFVYTLGVLVSFAAVGGLLLSLRAGGEALGWGFQFQSPTFVLLMALLFFALGLMLSGVFSLGSALIGIGAGLGDKPGLSGSFFTGVLATLAATPCTAPFMGAAIGFAVTASPPLAMAVFLSLGLGLALPYLLLTLMPQALRWLPKPGAWMERLKQLLAFPLFGAAIWLVWVLALQSGADGVLAVLAAMLVLAFAAWLFQATRGLKRTGRLAATASAVLLLLASVFAAPGLLPARTTAVASAVSDGSIESKPFSPERVAALRAEGQPVFVNFTAAWCITCLVNEEIAFRDEEVARAFADAEVTYLKADWTNRDPVIAEALAAYGRSGVPLYLLYPAGGGEAAVLPQILTVGGVLEALQAASNRPPLRQAGAMQ